MALEIPPPAPHGLGQLREELPVDGGSSAHDDEDQDQEQRNDGEEGEDEDQRAERKSPRSRPTATLVSMAPDPHGHLLSVHSRRPIRFTTIFPAMLMSVLITKRRSAISMRLAEVHVAGASENSLAMRLAMVFPGLNTLRVMLFELPMTIVTAMVSPKARPSERRIPPKMPERAKGG